jgi:hypothetical protein
VNEEHRITHWDDHRAQWVDWVYELNENPLSPILESEIRAHRETCEPDPTPSGHARAISSPFLYTYREICRLAKHGSIEAKPVLPFHLSDDRARREAIRTRGAEAVRAEFDTFQIHFQTYAQKKHHAKATLDRLKTLSPDGEISPEIYRRYLSRFEAALPFLFGLRRYPLPESYRRSHTYIAAASGMGKSTILRDMAYQYGKDPDSPSLIVIDPHGQLAEAIARFDLPNMEDRLIYFKPHLARGVSPVLNPLETKNKDPRIVNTATEEFIGQFKILLKDADNVTSQQMEAVLRPCVKALMLRSAPSTLADLVAFLEPTGKGGEKDARESLAYFQEALEILPNPSDRHFLETDFYSPNYSQTKLSLRTRFRSLMGTDAIYHAVCGESTFDLRKAMNRRGSIVVFNLSGIGTNATDTLGRFFVGMIQSTAQEREAISEEYRPQTHLFIDECQRFINYSTEKILTEARKFGLYLTLAQQIVGHGMDSKLEQIVLGNSGIKVCGHSDHKSLATMSKNMQIDDKELKTLRKFEFYASGSSFPPLRFKTANIKSDIVHTSLLGEEDASRWIARQADQRARYYRRITSAIDGNDTPIVEGSGSSSTAAATVSSSSVANSTSSEFAKFSDALIDPPPS